MGCLTIALALATQCKLQYLIETGTTGILRCHLRCAGPLGRDVLQDLAEIRVYFSYPGPAKDDHQNRGDNRKQFPVEAAIFGCLRACSYQEWMTRKVLQISVRLLVNTAP